MRPPNIVFRRLGDEVITVNLATDQIFELNRSAARVWELAVAGLSLSQIQGRLMAEFTCVPNAFDEISQAIAWLRSEGLLDDAN